MDKRKREIVALGLLVLLGLCVAAAMAWYIFVGHNWNKAASHIDDLVGSMEDYTVIVYEGIVPEPKPRAGAPAKSPEASEAGTARTAESQVGDASSASGAEVTLDDVVESYREKGAGVVTLHLDEIRRYEDPIIVPRANRRLGICAVPGGYRYVEVRDEVDALVRAQCDFTIAIADHPSIKNGWLRHVDLVVLACDGHMPSSGERIGGAYFVDSPYAGQIQAVIVSPSGTITAKVIDSL